MSPRRSWQPIYSKITRRYWFHCNQHAPKSKFQIKRPSWWQIYPLFGATTVNIQNEYTVKYSLFNSERRWTRYISFSGLLCIHYLESYNDGSHSRCGHYRFQPVFPYLHHPLNMVKRSRIGGLSSLGTYHGKTWTEIRLRKQTGKSTVVIGIDDGKMGYSVWEYSWILVIRILVVSFGGIIE